MQDLISHGAGWLWLLALAGIVCVGAAIAYGIFMRRERPRSDPTVQAVREEVTRQHYKSPEGQKP